MNNEFTLALVGAGNMGGAMLGGWLAQGVAASSITVIDPSPPQSMAAMMADAGVACFAQPPADYSPDVLILAVKPQIMSAVLPGLAPVVGPQTVCVSVAAGKTLAFFESALGASGGTPAVIRAMPNTPALVRRGVTVCCPNAAVTPVQRQRVDALLGAVGRVEWVDDEPLIDAVTAVSGSGPAYVFHLAECMAAAGVEAGLPEELAMILARETVAGAGELLARSPETPAGLRRNVTSPNGTTAAALEVLMGEGGLGPMMARAVAAAKRRAQELSQEAH